MHPDIEQSMKQTLEDMAIRDYRNYMSIAKYTPRDISGWLHKEGGMIGQDSAVNAVASVIYSHFHFPARYKRNLLLIGSTGCGKSELMRSCHRFLEHALSKRIADKLFLTADATQLNASGWRGGVKLADVLKNASTSEEMPYGTLLFIDEFDKLCEERWAGNGGGGAWSVNNLMQEQLLTTLDHQRFTIAGDDNRSFTVDAQRLSVVCLGAFTSIREKKRMAQLHKRRSIGFSSAVDIATDDTADCTAISTEDLCQFGMMPEIAGRLDPVMMDDVTPDMMYCIAVNAVKELNEAGKDLYTVSVPEAKLRTLADEAISKGLGGRYIRNTLNRLFDAAVFENPCRDLFIL
jgi:ATP-dependent Clp protease ATP-binding subunit ClpX